MKAHVPNNFDPNQEASYLEYSEALHGFVDRMASFKNADFAKFSRPYLEAQAQAFKETEATFIQLASQAEKTLSTLAEDHPYWDQAKRNFDITTATVSELNEIRHRLAQFMETGHFDKGTRQS